MARISPEHQELFVETFIAERLQFGLPVSARKMKLLQDALDTVGETPDEQERRRQVDLAKREAAGKRATGRQRARIQQLFNTPRESMAKRLHEQMNERWPEPEGRKRLRELLASEGRQ